MSATPIPRTLALILYGDLDISVMRELPPGRKPVKTYTARSKDRQRVDALMRRTVDAGEQVYVVCPIIEDSDVLDVDSATSTYNRLAQEVFPDHTVGLLHGGLKDAAKDSVMKAFLDGQVSVLVATTVVEVGVDNPNATMMVIENAERFGLAQLHQLRGQSQARSEASLCVLISDSDDRTARDRLKTLCLTTDGFELAEQDLRLRGPGEFFGTKQHGLPPLKLVNLYEDLDLVRDVTNSLDELFERDPKLQSRETRALFQAIRLHYPDARGLYLMPEYCGRARHDFTGSVG